MQLVIDQTGVTSSLDGVECRKWEGTGPDGCRFDVWVHRIQPLGDAAAEYAEACLSPFGRPERIEPKWFALRPDQVEAFVRAWLVESEDFTFPSQTLSAAYLLVRKAHMDGEHALALALIHLMAARVAGSVGEAAGALSDVLGDAGVRINAGLVEKALTGNFELEAETGGPK